MCRYTKLAYLAILLAALAISRSLHADSLALPYPWITTSNYGRFIFKMVPAKYREENGKSVMERKPYGVAYSINDEGVLEEMWRTEGWYAFEGYLSDDGSYFVRIGEWPSDQENHSDLALAFYDRGKLVKEYQVRQLIKMPELLSNSVSHYDWRAATQSKPTGFKGGTFHLVMIDKTAYDFSSSTGRVLLKYRDSGARSGKEQWAVDAAAAEKRARLLYERSDFHEDYDAHFVVSMPARSEIEDWRADLVPKKDYGAGCSVFAVFDISKKKLAGVTITSNDIDHAFQAALAHTYVAQRIKQDPKTTVRLQITKDRLHWDTVKLGEYLEELTGLKRGIGDALRQWAEIILNGSDKIYLNTDTGDLICTSLEGNTFKQLLLDAGGNLKGKSRGK